MISLLIGLLLGLVCGLLIGFALRQCNPSETADTDEQRHALLVRESRLTQTEEPMRGAKATEIVRVNPDRVFVTVQGQCYHLKAKCGGQPPTTKVSARRVLTLCSHCASECRREW